MKFLLTAIATVLFATSAMAKTVTVERSTTCMTFDHFIETIYTPGGFTPYSETPVNVDENGVVTKTVDILVSPSTGAILVVESTRVNKGIMICQLVQGHLKAKSRS